MNTDLHTRAPTRRPWPIFIAFVMIVISVALDRWVYDNMSAHTRQAVGKLEEEDWYRALRVVGYLPVWMVIGLCFLLIDLGRPPIRGGVIRRATLVVLCPAVAGVVSELVKMLVGRVRPGPAIAENDFFKPFLGGFTDGSNLAMPSSHAAVAFAGAFALSFILPRLTPVVILLAVGCGLSRILAGAHWLSDVIVAAAISYALSRALWRIDAHNNDGRPLGWPDLPARA